jgi:hypothetical protein
MAIAERQLASYFNRPEFALFDYDTTPCAATHA